MYQDYKNGGLRLTNLNWFITALKVGWLRRIFDENNDGLWNEYYLDKINTLDVKLVLESNLNTNDCKHISKENLFLQACW